MIDLLDAARRAFELGASRDAIHRAAADGGLLSETAR